MVSPPVGEEPLCASVSLPVSNEEVRVNIPSNFLHVLPSYPYMSVFCECPKMFVLKLPPNAKTKALGSSASQAVFSSMATPQPLPRDNNILPPRAVHKETMAYNGATSNQPIVFLGCLCSWVPRKMLACPPPQIPKQQTIKQSGLLPTLCQCVGCLSSCPESL